MIDQPGAVPGRRSSAVLSNFSNDRLRRDRVVLVQQRHACRRWRLMCFTAQTAMAGKRDADTVTETKGIFPTEPIIRAPRLWCAQSTAPGPVAATIGQMICNRRGMCAAKSNDGDSLNCACWSNQREARLCGRLRD